MRRHLIRQLGDAPITMPCAAAVVLLLVWVQTDSGQALTAWAPGALLVVVLLAVSLLLIAGWTAAPGPVRAATLALAAFTAWSYASILWAGDQGAAWEGANRTLLYLAVFALFALWRQRPENASALLTVWVLGMVVLALFALLRIPGEGDPVSLFVGDRLAEPAGYPNAAACQWLMAFWPAIALASSGRTHWLIRGALAGGAVILAQLALLSLSRGALIAVPLTAIVFLVFFGDRLRHFAVLLVVALAAGAGVSAVLDVGDAITSSGDPTTAINTMVRVVLLGALMAAAIVATAAGIESFGRPRRSTMDNWRRLVALAAVVVAVAGIGAAVVAVGNPVDRIDSGWSSFKGGYSEDSGSNRLTSGLGSNRYDFYRVAINVFGDQPVHGVGGDNFFSEYLRQGDSSETPRYPHSVELRTAEQTGIVGIVLLGAFLAFASVAVARAMRRADPVAAAAATGAVMVFVYWFVHGSADWFWEFAGLGATAFAMLGLACSLIERPETREPASPGVGVKALIGLGAGLAIVAIALPWMAEREVKQAAAVYDSRPFEAYDRLSRAAKLDPLSDRPDLVAGSIALRYRDYDRADAEFAKALERVPDGQYATLLRGAIASQRGDRAVALVLLDRAVALAPRDPLTVEARDVVRDGDQIDVGNLARAILERATQLTRG